MKKLHYNTVSKTLIKCLKELMNEPNPICFRNKQWDLIKLDMIDLVSQTLTPAPRKPNASAGDFYTFHLQNLFWLKMTSWRMQQLWQVTTQCKSLQQTDGCWIKKIYERFIFQLTDDEKVKVVTNCDQFKDLRFSYQNPYAFTESEI